MLLKDSPPAICLLVMFALLLSPPARGQWVASMETSQISTEVAAKMTQLQKNMDSWEKAIASSMATLSREQEQLQKIRGDLKKSGVRAEMILESISHTVRCVGLTWANLLMKFKLAEKFVQDIATANVDDCRPLEMCERFAAMNSKFIDFESSLEEVRDLIAAERGGRGRSGSRASPAAAARP